MIFGGFTTDLITFLNKRGVSESQHQEDYQPQCSNFLQQDDLLA
jgi:hypothetical protein